MRLISESCVSRISTTNMADLEDDDDTERCCHDLLIKLKKTAEGLLAAHTAQGVWGTYGGLRRVCLDTEAILCHRIKRSRASSESDGSFWQFVQGLKWLSPSMAPVIEKLNRPSQSRRLGSTEMGRTWLRESVQDHTLMTQLDVLLSDHKHLHHFYHDDAFLCQSDYVSAMRICFKAIELGKPALLSEISPNLLRSGQAGPTHPRSSSLSINRTHRLICLAQSPQSQCSDPSGGNKSSDMGNKHAHLNVTYSNQLNSSNVSLAVDPSLGASSLLHQKTLSDPYFVSSLDSPWVQENLGRDPFSDAVRNSQLASHLQTSRLQSFQLNRQILDRSQSQPQIQSQPQSQPHSLVHRDQSEYPPRIIVSSIGTPLDHTSSESDLRTSNVYERHKNPDTALRSHSEQLGNSESRSQSSLENITVGTQSLNARTSSCIIPCGTFENQTVLENSEAAKEKLQSNILNQREDTLDDLVLKTQICPSDAEDCERLNVVNFSKGFPTEAVVQVHKGLDHKVPVNEKNKIMGVNNGSHVYGDSTSALVLNLDNTAEGSRIENNVSGNSNHDLGDRTSSVVNSLLTNCHSVPSFCASNDEIMIKIIPETSLPPHDPSDTSIQAEMFSYQQNQTTSPFANDSMKPKFITVKSDPSMSISHPLLSHPDKTIPSNLHILQNENPSPGPYSPARPWADENLYKDSPSSSPVAKNFPGTLKSSGNVYIPQGSSDPNPALTLGNIHSSALSKHQVSSHAPSVAASRKLGHKRWVSDTSTILVDQFQKAKSRESELSSKSTSVSQPNGQNRRRASEFEPASYQGTLTKPAEGQSLMSYLTSQDFNTCANLEKENAHFRICEALIEAFESMKFNRMMKKQETGKVKSSSDSSSDEEIQELRQRIRIRKREKMMAKGRPFPSLSDEQTDTATTSQTASSPVSSQNEFSSFSGESESDDETDNGRNIDLTMSSDSQGNLMAIRSSGLNLSMASLYSDAELQRSNQQIEKNSTYDESANPGSAESIAISLLRKFSEKHLPKASELTWLVSERDAPQRLLPLPSSTPVSPDDAENADLLISTTRLRGNLEWAPPRAQIIFSVHTPEKRATLLSRQNFRCAGCGMRVDPAFMKRYRYCEYLGKYFCQCCHTGETSIIPGRVIEKWDFSRYPVANFSYSLLEKMWREPLFHVDTINPVLYKRVRGLESIRECRQQLIHLHSLLAICKRSPVLLKEIIKMPSHWISNDDAYSMEDFTEVRNGAMLNHLRSFITLAIAHVGDCQLCQGLGFICGMCQDQQVIYPFQLENVIKCPVCQSCYHKDCFIPEKCPKCIRLEARRRVQQEPLSPDSPDSGESDDTKDASQNINASG